MKTAYKSKMATTLLSLFAATWLLACNSNNEGTAGDTDSTGMMQEEYNDNTDYGNTGNPANVETGGGVTDSATDASGRETNDSLQKELKSHGNIQESNVPR